MLKEKLKDLLRSLWRSKTGTFGMIVVLLFLFCALFAPVIMPYDPFAMALKSKLMPPCWAEGGSMAHLLGTDQLGRDLLSRLLYGSRISLGVAVAGTVVSAVVGVILGALAGFYGKAVDSVIGRIMDIQLAFPFILLAIFVVSILGSGLQNIVLVAGISGWVRFARVVRGEIISIKQMEYVEAVRSLGGKDFRIIFRHILPNVISPLIVIATLELAKVILMEASLSYLGMGVPIDIPTWGRLLSDSRDYMQAAPHLTVLPGLMISILVLGVNLFGDWLRDYLDPKLDTNQ